MPAMQVDLWRTSTSPAEMIAMIDREACGEQLAAWVRACRKEILKLFPGRVSPLYDDPITDSTIEGWASVLNKLQMPARCSLLRCLIPPNGERVECPRCHGTKRGIVSDSFSNKTGDKRRNHWGHCRRCMVNNKPTGSIPAPLVREVWRTDAVRRLAEQIRGGQPAPGSIGAIGGRYKPRFDLMPLLADALGDAGCDSEDIISHCRETVHTQHCWVLESILKGTA